MINRQAFKTAQLFVSFGYWSIAMLYLKRLTVNKMNNLINTYRRRILKAALLRHQRKTGSNCLVIKLNKGGINTVELTEILLDGLLRKFERLAISEYGNVEGVKAIKEFTAALLMLMAAVNSSQIAERN